eukprot:3778563-Amphidinium_carterae.1
MHKFLVPKGKGAVADAEAAQTDLEEKATLAARHSSPWPPDWRKSRGRPSLDKEWLILVQRKIDNGEEIPEDVTSSRPKWWKPGM